MMDVTFVFISIFCFFNIFEKNINDYPITTSSNETDIKNPICNYDTLVTALKKIPDNAYHLQTVFFPPQKDIPLYVTVTYKFPDNTSIDYIWSTAALYFTVHPHILSFLSLFFSYIEDNRIVELELELPEQCSYLAKITQSDKDNYLFVLTHRLRYHIQESTEYEDLEANVVAAQNRKKEYDTVYIRVFFSLIIALPILILLLMWITVPASIPYIRNYVNNSDNFSSIAGIYWICQTFIIFVIVMDAIALWKNGDLDKPKQLEAYQRDLLYIIVGFEGFGFFFNNLILLCFPLSSHKKSRKHKDRFEKCFNGTAQCLLFCCLVPFKGIERKEARIWFVLSGLVVPIIALSSHIGFVVGGWVSYEDRSVAIVLLILFCIVFLYWTFQYMYQLCNSVCTSRRRGKCRCYCRNRSKIRDPEKGMYYHYERELYTMSLLTNLFGFDTIALTLTSSFLVPIYGFIVYFGSGLIVPLLSTIDEALVHIFKLGNFVFVIVAFLLTYQVLTIKGGGGGAARLISNDALKFWKFLVRNHRQKDHILALKLAMKRLQLSLKAIGKDNTGIGDRKYELECVKEHLAYTIEYFKLHEWIYVEVVPTRRESGAAGEGNAAGDGGGGATRETNAAEEGNIIVRVLKAEDGDVELKSIYNTDYSPENFAAIARQMNEFCKKEELDLSDFAGKVDDWIKKIDVEQTDAKKAKREKLDMTAREEIEKVIKDLCTAVNLFQKIVVRVLGVPPMYYNKDQANALAAALIYDKVNNCPHLSANEPELYQREKQRHLLLFSLIEEDL